MQIFTNLKKEEEYQMICNENKEITMLTTKVRGR